MGKCIIKDLDDASKSEGSSEPIAVVVETPKKYRRLRIYLVDEHTERSFQRDWNVGYKGSARAQHRVKVTMKDRV